MSQRPHVVILLDIDGTILGDVSWLVYEHSAIYEYNRLTSGPRIRPMASYTHADLEGGLIRPYFEFFIKTLKRRYSEVEFFIYTASEPAWAEHIVTKLENVINFKFNRPLFTRSQCRITSTGQFVKSLDVVQAAIVRRLKHAPIRSIILIDNTPEVLLQHRQHQVLCPTYDFKLCLDMLRQIPPAIQQTSMRFFMPAAVAPAEDKPSLQPQKQLSLYHRYLASCYQECHKYNKTQRDDTFWKDLTRRCLETDIVSMSSSDLKAWLSQLT